MKWIPKLSDKARKAKSAEKRRRACRKACPEVDPRSFNTLGAGHCSQGGRAVRAWLRSVEALAGV